MSHGVERAKRLRDDLVMLRKGEGVTLAKMAKASALLEALSTDSANDAVDQLHGIVLGLRSPRGSKVLLNAFNYDSVDMRLDERRRRIGSVEAVTTWENEAIVELLHSLESVERLETSTSGSQATGGLILDPYLAFEDRVPATLPGFTTIRLTIGSDGRVRHVMWDCVRPMDNGKPDSPSAVAETYSRSEDLAQQPKGFAQLRVGRTAELRTQLSFQSKVRGIFWTLSRGEIGQLLGDSDFEASVVFADLEEHETIELFWVLDS